MRVRRHTIAIVATLSMLAGLLPLMPAVAVENPSSTVFINEIHYDNDGTDEGEAIEVAGPAGTDLTGWSIVLYNGANGSVYSDEELTGVIPDQADGYGTLHLDYPENGIQNGAPDGVALVDDSGTLVQFLSYEGAFTGSGGPADGQTSTDIGVSESSSTTIGQSLQVIGTGLAYGDFTWAPASTSSFGSPNSGQSFEEPDPNPDPSETPVFVNEIHYDNAGTDAGEAIEIAGPAGTDLAEWSIILYNGANGSVYSDDALSGTIPDEGSGFGAVVIEYATNGIQNGAPDGIALVNDSEQVIQFLSYEGVMEGSGGPADGMVSTDIGVSQNAEDPSLSLQLTGEGTVYEEFSWTSAESSFGCLNAGQADIAGAECGVDPDPDEPEEALISEIQGDGDASGMVGDAVIIEGVVVGDYEGESPNLRGFYVQEEEADWDDDQSTSEGLFVFHGNEDVVDLGDVVRVTGTVSEFQDQTQLDFPSDVEVIGSGESVPPTQVTLPIPSAGHLERYEGMLVEFPQNLYVTEFFQLGRFGQVVVSSGDRLNQPTAVAEPGSEANAVQAANDLNRLILDDTTNDQNPDPIIFGRNGDPLTADNTLRGGDTVTGPAGVLTYTWAGNSASGNAYRLRPIEPGQTFDFEAQNPRPTDAPDVGGSLQVASFNVLNYFLTLDQGGNTCGEIPQDCRGAETAEEFERQRTKLLSALVRLDADVLGLMELENTPGVSPERDIAAGLNDELGDGTYAAVDAGTVGDDVIRVGMIYKPDSVTPLGEPGIVDYGDGLNRASLTQTFVENSTGEVFSVVVNHFKSKGCTDATGANADQGDGQGCWNPARVGAAEALVANLGDLGEGDEDWLIIGDLNSYDREDPIEVIRDAGYTDLTLEHGGEEAYGYVFDGQWGYLDYALASPTLLPQVTGSAEYHINADEPSVLDYNTNFKTPAQVESLYSPDEYRTSDHDPVLVGLELDGGINPKLRAVPGVLVVPTHKLRRVNVIAPRHQVEILDVTSSEADSGLGLGDKPDDIVILDNDTVKLRAEYYSTDGRVYTIDAKASRGGQVVVDTTEVIVPNFLGWVFGWVPW